MNIKLTESFPMSLRYTLGKRFRGHGSGAGIRPVPWLTDHELALVDTISCDLVKSSFRPCRRGLFEEAFAGRVLRPLCGELNTSTHHNKSFTYGYRTRNKKLYCHVSASAKNQAYLNVELKQVLSQISCTRLK